MDIKLMTKSLLLRTNYKSSSAKRYIARKFLIDESLNIVEVVVACAYWLGDMEQHYVTLNLVSASLLSHSLPSFLLDCPVYMQNNTRSL